MLRVIAIINVHHQSDFWDYLQWFYGKIGKIIPYYPFHFSFGTVHTTTDGEIITGFITC